MSWLSRLREQNEGAEVASLSSEEEQFSWIVAGLVPCSRCGKPVWIKEPGYCASCAIADREKS